MKEEMVQRTPKNRLVVILIAVIAVLALLVIYAFAIRPAVSGYTINAQNAGINYALSAIVSQVQQNGYAQIPVGNQTLILVPYNAQAQASANQTSSSK
ncbi:MAG: hypothetical protein KGH55_01855 [Nanoarchaeota archaeon]|nr:hypothetical protein [Nanoarchaeota archaeon]